MNIDEIFAEIDRLYTANQGEKVEEYILGKIAEAAEAGNENIMIQLLNELIGHYRETSEFDKLRTFADKLLGILEGSSLKGSMAHATSLLNVANAYRAAGMLRESNALYQQVKSYYDANVAPDSMLYASLLNNMSLLFQEMNDYESAADCLERALGISLIYPECRIEQATTYTNLAVTLIKLGRMDEAESHLHKAFELFDEDDEPDYHYSAAASAMAEIKYFNKDYAASVKYYEKALEVIERCVGKSRAYEITKQNMESAAAKLEADNAATDEKPDDDSVREDPRTFSGLEIARLYYEEFGRKMIHEKFPSYESRIAVGLAGEGSDCFGFDDETSHDHDWGPGFCMWLTYDDYEKIGATLQEEYDKLPEDFMGYKRRTSPVTGRRDGVSPITTFYMMTMGMSKAPSADNDWLMTDDEKFATAINGEVFRDDLGKFSAIRDSIMLYYPNHIWRRKIAYTAASMSQTGQYNYNRMLGRGDCVTAAICLGDFIKHTMSMLYLLDKKYAPYYKWMFKGLEGSEDAKSIRDKLMVLTGSHPGDKKVSGIIEEICSEILERLHKLGLARNSDNYLDHHVIEILHPECLNANKEIDMDDNNSIISLIDKIVTLEWNAFDKVINEGGRASCQDDFSTFSVMRKSQYMLWSREMLESFIDDFETANAKGWNLITEKYGRMEESTAPEEYAKIKDSLPELSDDKKQIIEAIVAIQVGMMEEFAREYPKSASEARSIHTSEDTPDNTSYETYLRGEISTYSDRTLELYGRFVAGYAKEGRNIAKETITNSALLYGYKSLDHMESKL